MKPDLPPYLFPTHYITQHPNESTTMRTPHLHFRFHDDPRRHHPFITQHRTAAGTLMFLVNVHDWTGKMHTKEFWTWDAAFAYGKAWVLLNLTHGCASVAVDGSPELEAAA